VVSSPALTRLAHSGLAAKRMRLPSTSATEAAVDEDCIYEVLWSADSVAAANKMPRDSVAADAESAAAFRVRQGEAARSLSATLSALQCASNTGVRGIAISESGAARGVSGVSAAAALLRCAARELPEVFASSSMASSSMPGSGTGGAQVMLDRVADAARASDVQGSCMGDGAVWRPRLARSAACEVAGEDHPASAATAGSLTCSAGAITRCCCLYTRCDGYIGTVIDRSGRGRLICY